MKKTISWNLCFFISFIGFFLSLPRFLDTFAFPTRHLCHSDQKNALLEFKSEFQIIEFQIPTLEFDPCGHNVSYPKTKSWENNSDCCYWDGVTCDAVSGVVIGLDLSCGGLYGTFKPNTSLSRLNHLRSLNLAYNAFNGSSIPSEFSKFTRLTRLNLSNSVFSGRIPAEILQLTKLVSLDLTFPCSDCLFAETPFLSTLARNLTNLRELRLSYTNIPSTVPENFANLSSLRLLHLGGCNLYGKFPDGVFLLPNIASIVLSSNINLTVSLPEFPGNSSLKSLDLSVTKFSGSLPDSIGKLKWLNFLDLSGTKISGSLPDSIGNLKSLDSLDLSYTNISGILPDSIGNLTSLKSLYLSFNNFFGRVPSSIGNLNQLTELDLSNNKLTGNFPLELLNLTRLSNIDLHSNEFTGPLPSEIGNFSHLCLLGVGPHSVKDEFPICRESSRLFLYGNNFSGPIPTSISKLVNLEYLDLSYVSTNDTTDFSIFSDLKSLTKLFLSGNSLSVANVNSTSHFRLHLEMLGLSACNITEFPDFLRTQQDLWHLDLSSNKIKGQVPKWLWRLPMLEEVFLSHNSFSSFEESPKVLRQRNIWWLDLSSNSFQGPFPVPPVSTAYLLASANNFTENIPRHICRLRSLAILDLSNNMFSGSIPQCLGNSSNHLWVMNLRRNNLSGSLPDTFNGSGLVTLDIGHNRLTGKLPKSLINCVSLRVLNVENNRFNDTFPFWLEALQELQVLVLRSNGFHGPLSLRSQSFLYPKLQIIDISHNDFTGSLPKNYFVNWKTMSSIKTIEEGSGLYLKDVSGYYYSTVFMNKGVETEMVRIFASYTGIDFSGNKFQGQIPESIGLLKGLIVLNLSNNAFTDHIPPSLANLTDLESLDLSQNRLSGKIPPELSSLTFLEYINISHNQLVGPLPQGTQFQRQHSSSFEGNPGLCGPPLQRTCGDVNTPPTQPKQTSEHKEEVMSWIAAAIGYAPGLVFGLTIGYIVTSYKHQWFMKFFGRNKRRCTRTR